MSLKNLHQFRVSGLFIINFVGFIVRLANLLKLHSFPFKYSIGMVEKFIISKEVKSITKNCC